MQRLVPHWATNLNTHQAKCTQVHIREICNEYLMRYSQLQTAISVQYSAETHYSLHTPPLLLLLLMARTLKRHWQSGQLPAGGPLAGPIFWPVRPPATPRGCSMNVSQPEHWYTDENRVELSAARLGESWTRMNRRT